MPNLHKSLKTLLDKLEVLKYILPDTGNVGVYTAPTAVFQQSWHRIAKVIIIIKGGTFSSINLDLSGAASWSTYDDTINLVCPC
jgi:hypothetical protein